MCCVWAWDRNEYSVFLQPTFTGVLSCPGFHLCDLALKLDAGESPGQEQDRPPSLLATEQQQCSRWVTSAQS